MKKNIGSKPALYPMPITVVGAMNDDKYHRVKKETKRRNGRRIIRTLFRREQFAGGCVRMAKRESNHRMNA